MSSSYPPAGVATVAIVLATAGCAMRVGSGGPPPPNGDVTKGEVFGMSACLRVGGETKVAFGAGAESFAFVWDSDRYVVVYTDRASGDVFVGQLAPDGTAIGTPTDVQMTAAKSDLPSLLKTANGYFVAWEEGSAGSSIYARALGPDALPLGDGMSVAATQLQQSRPVLARAPGGRVAVAWMDQFADGGQGVAVALIDPSSLRLTGPQRMASADVDGWPWIAGDDGSLAMVWRDQATETNGLSSFDIAFSTLDPENLQTSPPTSLRGGGRTAVQLPRMIRTDFGFLAAWEDMRGSDNAIFMSLVGPTGVHIGGGLVEEPNSGDANWPNMAWTGTAASIVYYQWRDNRPQVFMSFVDGKGLRVGGLHDLQVSNGQSGTSKYPDVVWTGREFGVMYVDTRDGTPGLWFQRVACHAA